MKLHKKRILSATVAISMLAVGLAACATTPEENGGGGNTPTDGGGSANLEPLRISYLADTTGVGATYGESYETGAKFIIDKINAEGGINGRMIAASFTDTASTPQTGVAEITATVASDSVAAFYAALGAIALPMAPIAQQGGMPFIIGQAATPAITDEGDYIYRVTNPEYEYLASAFELLKEEQGIQSVGAVYADDNTSTVVLATDYIPTAAAEAGLEVGALLPVKSTEVDYTGVAARIAEENPDLLFLGTLGNSINSLATALRRAGYEGQFFATTNSASGELAGSGADSVGTYGLLQFAGSEELPWESGNRFSADFKAEHGRYPTSMEAGGADQILFFAAAAESLGDQEITRESLNEALRKVATEGFSAASGDPLKLDERRVGVSPGVLTLWDGEAHVLAPYQRPDGLLPVDVPRGAVR